MFVVNQQRDEVVEMTSASIQVFSGIVKVNEKIFGEYRDSKRVKEVFEDLVICLDKRTEVYCLPKT